MPLRGTLPPGGGTTQVIALIANRLNPDGANFTVTNLNVDQAIPNTTFAVLSSRENVFLQPDQIAVSNGTTTDVATIQPFTAAGQEQTFTFDQVGISFTLVSTGPATVEDIANALGGDAIQTGGIITVPTVQQTIGGLVDVRA